MNNTLLTVTIPLHNAEATISDTIASILNQTYPYFEIIVVDDCSTDNSLKKVRSFNDNRIRLFHNQVNQGPFFSRNIGLKKAKGDFITNVDADDILSPHRFQFILDYFSQHPEIQYLETRYLRFREKSSELWFRNWTRGVGYPVFRRKVIEEIGYFLPLRARGDREYSLRVEAHFGPDKVKLLNHFTYWAEQSEKNITTKIPTDNKPSLEIKKYAIETFHKRNDVYVDFPFTQKIINEFKNFELFITDLSPDLREVQEIELKNSETQHPDAEINYKIIQFNEQAVTEYYSRLQEAFENFRLIQKKLGLKKPKSDYDFADFNLYSEEILAEIKRIKKYSLWTLIRKCKKLLGM